MRLPTLLTLTALLLTQPLFAQELPPSTSAPATTRAARTPHDNTEPPYMAVYRWGQSGLNHGLYDAYPTWLNREIVWGEDFQPIETWDNIQGQGWQLGPWSKWVQAKEGRRYLYSVVLLPGSWDGKGPKKGLGAGVPVSLEEGAKGTYNEHFKKLAENLVKYKLENSILRLGWEFNGGWYTFRAAKKEEAFKEYWRQIVKTMRSVPGGEKLQFCWNPTNNFVQTDATLCWPGDEYVDYVGVDVYDQSWLANTYPFPKDATPEEIQQRRERAWNVWIFGKEHHGLAMWRDFAKQHKKPLAIPEWGLCIRGDHHGGLDNVYFIEQMHKFITDPANNVAFHCYFDVTAGDGDHQICPDPENKQTTKLPLSSARFKELFTLPPTTAPASAPATQK